MSLHGTTWESLWKIKRQPKEFSYLKDSLFTCCGFLPSLYMKKPIKDSQTRPPGMRLLVFRAISSFQEKHQVLQQTLDVCSMHQTCWFSLLEAANGHLATKLKLALEPITPKAHIFLVSGVCQLQWATRRDKIMIFGFLLHTSVINADKNDKVYYILVAIYYQSLCKM